MHRAEGMKAYVVGVIVCRWYFVNLEKMALIGNSAERLITQVPNRGGGVERGSGWGEFDTPIFAIFACQNARAF